MTVIGDTVGDPFTDTSGPSINILIKLISMVSVATIGITMAVNNGPGGNGVPGLRSVPTAR